MKTLEEKINKAHNVIREALKKWKKEDIFIAWTGGKDSTVLLHLVREVFKGKIPFKIFFNDSTLEFPEIYRFVKKIEKDWKLNLLWIKHLPEDLEDYEKTKNKEKKMEIMSIAKINAINFVISKYKVKAFLSGIRRDEHRNRAQEKYFSPRPTNIRVHPILDFTLNDIWTYIKKYKVPYVSLYDKGYKSLGEAPFTKPVKNKNAHERTGREATKEKTMDRLRKLGYW
ncbi:MAG: phosphoadenosine phosphosulfate reductase family protein [Patescibacteria group bacterium]